jgi:hypothetical protein
MTQRKKSSFKTWERKILRKLYGPIEGSSGWRIRTNYELQVGCRQPNIVTTIKTRRLDLAGHVVRTSDDGTAKKMFRGKPGGRRKAGRPRLVWLDY